MYGVIVIGLAFLGLPYLGIYVDMGSKYNETAEDITKIRVEKKLAKNVKLARPSCPRGHDQTRVALSPGGKKVAYVEKVSKEKQRVVVNGSDVNGKQEGKLYDDICDLAFDASGESVIYTVRLGTVLVVDSKEIKHRLVDKPIIGEGKTRIAFVAEDGDLEYVVVDGEEEERYEKITNLGFSVDGAVQYLASNNYSSRSFKEENITWQVVIAGKEVGELVLPSTNPIYHFVSGRYAYIESIDRDSKYVVVDGVEHDVFDEVASLSFSPDGEHVVYMVRMVNEDYVVEGESFVVLDGTEKKHYYKIDTTSDTWSASGDRYAYYAVGMTGVNLLVINDREFQVKGKYRQQFDLGGSERDYVYVSATDSLGNIPFPIPGMFLLPKIFGWDKGDFVVGNGSIGKHYHGVFAPGFSKDGGKIDYAALDGDDLLLVVESL